MFDLYQALVPVFSIITLLNLLSLKLALRDNVTLSKIYNKKASVELMLKQNQEQSQSKSTLKFMLLNFTPLEFFVVRKARYKIPFFLAVSIIALASYFIQAPFAFTFVGSVSYFTYFLVAMATFRSENEKKKSEQSPIYRQKYLQVIFGVISIVVNIVIIGIVFKNYKNSVLSSFVADACINIALDSFIVRPILITLIGLPLSKSISVANYVTQCQKQLNLLQVYEEIGQREMLSKPGKQLSPNKIARKIPVDFQIEPVPIDHQKMVRNVEMLRKIKKDRTLTPINTKAERNIECDLTINSLLNSNKKQQDHNIQDVYQNEDNKENAEPQGSLPMKKKYANQNLIKVNPSLQQQIQNQEDITAQQAVPEKVRQQSYQSTNNRQFEGAVCNGGLTYEEDKPVKISINSSSQPISGQQPLRICQNGEINLDQQQNFNQQEDIGTDNYRKRKDIQSIDQGFSKNSFGILEIKQQNHVYRPSDEIEEIDLNSPQRRKRSIHVELEEESKLDVVKRKKKKFSHDQNQNRVIKFSSGEPYLEYLPHMLAKDNKAKKSQVLGKKEVIVDIRATNSLKRPKKRLLGIQNNENIIPEFKIEEL